MSAIIRLKLFAQSSLLYMHICSLSLRQKKVKKNPTIRLLSLQPNIDTNKQHLNVDPVRRLYWILLIKTSLRIDKHINAYTISGRIRDVIVCDCITSIYGAFHKKKIHCYEKLLLSFMFSSCFSSKNDSLSTESFSISEEYFRDYFSEL